MLSFFVNFVNVIPCTWQDQQAKLVLCLKKAYSTCFFSLLLIKVLAQSSVLATGEWYKFGVTQDGIHKIDASFLKKIGINLTGLNPKNLRIFGNGGAMLPQANAIIRANDLTENAIFVEGETDGKFDNQDFILFYGESPHRIFYDEKALRFRHETNVYCDTTYYFLNISTSAGLRVQEAITVAANQTITSYDNYIFYEKDLKNIVNSGREWYGEDFGSLTNSRDFSFNSTNLLANSKILLTSAVVGAAYGITKMQVSLSGGIVGTQEFNAITPDRYDYKGRETINTFVIDSKQQNGSDLKINLRYDRNGLSSGIAYLNYLGLQTRRELWFEGQSLFVRSLESLLFPSVTYQIKNSTNNILKIWDLTNPVRPQNITANTTASFASFSAESKSLHTFLLFSGNDFPEPIPVRTVRNQNLHGFSTPNLLIISPEKFKEQALRLADFRRTNDGLTVQVATTEEVFNEFASGQPDVSAIRDFTKYLYDRQPQTLRYLLLFGDAKYDAKNRLLSVTSSQLNDYVPVYESRESLTPLYSYSSDDYFGFLENTEGIWSEDYAGDHSLDIGIGRLPIKNITEAQIIVDKLIRYTSPEALGDWRQKINFVADDGDGNIHQADADYLAQSVNSQYPAYHVNKIFLDAYTQTTDGSGQKAPSVNDAIRRSLDKSLIINYTGHGGESGWAEEQILTRADILSWNNFNRLPLLVTATCEFGRYDDPNVVSGAELALLSAKGGAIGLLTTTRPVFANTNFLVNDAFYHFAFQAINNQMPRLGDLMRLTKNNSLSGRNNRNFALLGDPSMRLAYPQQQIVITKLNSKTLEKTDTLRALSKITLEGEVRVLGSQAINSSFNGQVFVKVFDKETQMTTLGTESSRMSFVERKNLLFEGLMSIRNGRFVGSFVLPKDIDYRYGLGKILLYATSSDNKTDAAGTLTNVVVGGGTSVVADNQAPNIQAFMNDEGFKNGMSIPANSSLIVKLSDANGINLALGGIGHETTAILDDTLKYILNEYFSPTLDDFKSGTIYFSFLNLLPGIHQLKVKSWDSYNNPAEVILNFVVDKQIPNLRNVRCFPNPFVDQTTFAFDHDWQGSDLEVILEIFNATGQRVYHLERTEYQAISPFTNLMWAGITDSGEKIAKGIYFYRIFARSINTQKQASGTGKVLFWP